MSGEVTSTVPAAITALHQRLANTDWQRGEVDTLLTSDSIESTREAVLLGEVRGQQEWQNLGAKGAHARSEEYELACYIIVRRPGDVRTEAMGRAFDLFAQIERLLADPDWLAIRQDLGVQWNGISNMTGTPTMETEGSGFVLAFTIEFHARINPRGN